MLNYCLRTNNTKAIHFQYPFFPFRFAIALLFLAPRPLFFSPWQIVSPILISLRANFPKLKDTTTKYSLCTRCFYDSQLLWMLCVSVSVVGFEAEEWLWHAYLWAIFAIRDSLGQQIFVQVEFFRNVQVYLWKVRNFSWSIDFSNILSVALTDWMT